MNITRLNNKIQNYKKLKIKLKLKKKKFAMVCTLYFVLVLGWVIFENNGGVVGNLSLH